MAKKLYVYCGLNELIRRAYFMNLKQIGRNYIGLLFLLTLSQSTMAQDSSLTTNSLFDQTKLELVSKEFKFTEGPSADRDGNVFFTDQPNNSIWEYSNDGTLSMFMANAGRANGTYFDRKGNLIVCADEKQQLWAITPSKHTSVLLSSYKGKHLNGPNDLWVDNRGGIYITDPYYQRDYWERKQPELPAECVYYLPKGKKELIMVSDLLKKPNGIVGTPDGKTLYVADIGGDKTYKFSIHEDGTLGGPEVFVNQGADGITIDEAGNLYLAGKGVTIYNKNGIKVGHIEVNEPWTANLCFGGKDNNELFITASTALYKIPMKVKGCKYHE
jgi:gluconolactonase